MPLHFLFSSFSNALKSVSHGLVYNDFPLETVVGVHCCVNSGFGYDDEAGSVHICASLSPSK